MQNIKLSYPLASYLLGVDIAAEATTTMHVKTNKPSIVDKNRQMQNDELTFQYEYSILYTKICHTRII